MTKGEARPISLSLRKNPSIPGGYAWELGERASLRIVTSLKKREEGGSMCKLLTSPRKKGTTLPPKEGWGGSDLIGNREFLEIGRVRNKGNRGEGSPRGQITLFEGEGQFCRKVSGVKKEVLRFFIGRNLRRTNREGFRLTQTVVFWSVQGDAARVAPFIHSKGRKEGAGKISCNDSERQDRQT